MNVAKCRQTLNFIARSHQQHGGNTAHLATLKKLTQRYPEMGKAARKGKHNSHEHHLKGRGRGGRGRGKIH
ncbi:hypothetical protein E2C01_100628 [Portunus trituberculatus]|uniref:Uncharacterized protein n=1 Tax=Portunus trituberculatus TaxID=210409 RepID=A0A5B7KJX3_PORTR|nr:hypothetical protein [Portunus trituberculatus]